MDEIPPIQEAAPSPPRAVWWLLGIGVFLLYWLCGSSSFDFGDPALMMGRAKSPPIGIGPSDHPLLYVLLWPFTPKGDAGLLIANHLFGAGSAVLLAAATARLLKISGWRWALALTLMASLGHTLSLKSTLLDVYALQMLLNAAIFYALVRVEEPNEMNNRCWYWLFAVFLGLQVSNHLWTVFLLPGATLWGLSLAGRKKVTLGAFVLGGGIAVLASGLYTFPAIAHMLYHGFGSWFDTTLGSDEVGGKFHGYLKGGLMKGLGITAGLWLWQWPLISWVLVLGLWRLLRDQVPLLLILLAFSLPSLVESALYKESHQYELMITHYQFLFPVVVAGVLALFKTASLRYTFLQQKGAETLLALTLFGVGVQILVVVAAEAADLRLTPARDFPLRNENTHFLLGQHPGYNGARRYAEWIVDSLPEHSRILADWSFYAVLIRIQEEGQRSDLSITGWGSPSGREAFWDIVEDDSKNAFVTFDDPMFVDAAKQHGLVLQPVWAKTLDQHRPMIFRLVRNERAVGEKSIVSPEEFRKAGLPPP